jgi:hypothetical protein
MGNPLRDAVEADEYSRFKNTPSQGKSTILRLHVVQVFRGPTDSEKYPQNMTMYRRTDQPI